MTREELHSSIVRFVQNSVYFDDKWYREKYDIPDGTWAAGHYFIEGWRSGFDPSEYFSTREYLERNQDVLNAGVNPLSHYECYGKYENNRYPQLQKNVDRVLGNNDLYNHRIDSYGVLRVRITNRCNGRCRYCGLRAWSQEEQKREMDPKWYYEYCKPLYEKVTIVLITGGDAYVAKESYNYMEFLSKNYPEVTIATESNGIAFSKRFRELACENLFKTHFSINASNAKTFVKGCWDGPNGHVAYERSLENIRAYVELLKEKNRLCFAPSLSMVINRDTANDVLAFARLALSLHAFAVNFYFDYTENNMQAPNFSNPETSRPALKQLMEIERVLAGKVHVYFRLWIPYEEPGRLQQEVDAIPIEELQAKYEDLLELVKGRSMIEEFEKRTRIRAELGKRPLTMEVDYSSTIRMMDVGGKHVCFAAWSELDLYPNGRIDFCGWFRPTLNIKDYIRDDTLDWEDILNSGDYRICRRNILNDNFQGCMSSCPMNSCTSEIVSPFKYGLEREMNTQTDKAALPTLRPEQEIMRNWTGDISKPVVSIGCVTYNHEEYIRDTLKGFLIQETSFPFEILIHDDASSDKTTDIIREYERRYPHLIKAFYETENRFSKHDGTFEQIIATWAKATYYAPCEGDDYWTDPLKLQKQVDFLEAHPECSLCFHPVAIKHEDSRSHDYIFPNPQTHPFVYQNIFTELRHLIPFNYIQTNSVMYRWRFNTDEMQGLFPRNMLPGDWFLHLLHAETGKIGFIDETMAVYRRHSGGIWWESGRNQEKFLLQNGLLHLACYQAIEQRWPDQASVLSKRISTEFAANVILAFFKTQNVDGLEELKRRFPEFYSRASEYLASLSAKPLDGSHSKKSDKAGSPQESTGAKGSTETSTQRPHLAAPAPREKEEVSSSSESTSGYSRPLVSIVIPLFNKLDFTQKCLRALFQNTPDGVFELIIIDNGSTDGTKPFLQTITPIRNNVKVITNAKNAGFAKACNQGAREASAENVLFLNNDTEPVKGWLEPLLDIIDNDDTVAAVGSKLLYPDMTIQHAGIVIVNDIANNDPLQARNNHVNRPSTIPEANEATVYQALTAACLLVRKSDFQRANEFDEEYWNGYEDVDLCFKLREQGKKLVYQPASTVVHHESKSGPERFIKARDNILRLHKKWLGKIEPDIILQKDGVVTPTGAKIIRPYHAPEAIVRTTDPASKLLEGGFVSVIILTHNQLEHTKLCLQSIEQHTAEPHEIIIVDNGSTDGTLDYLSEYVHRCSNVRVVSNRENLGFAAGNNQGLALATGDYVLLLNNDTVVTDGWLTRMLSVFDRFPETGIVGPVTNYISGPQLVAGASYKSLPQMHAFAQRWALEHDKQSMEFFRVVGFCLLAKRQVIDRIGGLDERFGTGNFEDDDFCLRAAAAGYKARIAQDAFVHHTGSQTFKGAGIDYQQSMERNWKIFKAKWKLSDTLPYGSYSINLGEFRPDRHYIQIPDRSDVELLIVGAPHRDTENTLPNPVTGTKAEVTRPRQPDGNRPTPENQDGAKERRIINDLHQQALLLQEAGKTDLAIKQLELILELQNNSPEILNDIGVMHHQSGDNGKALEYLRRAVELDPCNTGILKSLGALLLEIGTTEEAIDIFFKVIDLEPNDIETLGILGDLSLQYGQEESARSFFAKILTVDPHNARAREWVESANRASESAS